MKKHRHWSALSWGHWLCVISGAVLCIGPGLGSRRVAIFWMLGGCLLFLIGWLCAWIDSRRRRKEKIHGETSLNQGAAWIAMESRLLITASSKSPTTAHAPLGAIDKEAILAQMGASSANAKDFIPKPAHQNHQTTFRPIHMFLRRNKAPIRAIACAIACVAFSSCTQNVFRDETRSSSGFSEQEFQAVSVGMSMTDVIGRLGKPLEISTQTWSEVWCYQPRKIQPVEPTGKKGDIYAYRINPLGKFTRLRFSESGVVETFWGDYLGEGFVGLTKAQVIAKSGEPMERELTPFAIIYHYTRPAKSGTYKMRQVHFDVTKSVVSKVAETYYD